MNMAVKGAKTINEYKLRKWTEENFIDGSVTFQLSDAAKAELTDRKGHKMTIGINQDGKVDILEYSKLPVRENSVLGKLNEFSKNMNNCNTETQNPKVNNLVHQRNQNER